MAEYKRFWRRGTRHCLRCLHGDIYPYPHSDLYKDTNSNSHLHADSYDCPKPDIYGDSDTVPGSKQYNDGYFYPYEYGCAAYFYIHENSDRHIYKDRKPDTYRDSKPDTNNNKYAIPEPDYNAERVRDAVRHTADSDLYTDCNIDRDSRAYEHCDCHYDPAEYSHGHCLSNADNDTDAGYQPDNNSNDNRHVDRHNADNDSDHDCDKDNVAEPVFYSDTDSRSEPDNYHNAGHYAVLYGDTGNF